MQTNDTQGHITFAICWLFGSGLVVCQYLVHYTLPIGMIGECHCANAKQIKKALRGVKVEVTHRGNLRRKYRVSGLTSQPTHELMYVLESFLLLFLFPFLPFILLFSRIVGCQI